MRRVGREGTCRGEVAEVERESVRERSLRVEGREFEEAEFEGRERKARKVRRPSRTCTMSTVETAAPLSECELVREAADGEAKLEL